MSTRWSSVLAAAMLGPLALSACHRAAPTGEVVATVDGTEITSGEVETEARATGRSLSGPQAPAVRNEILSQLVDRAVLAKQAERAKIDRMPGFIIARHRGEQLLLAQAELSRSLHNDDSITDAQVSSYVASHPTLFADRQQLHVDGIRLSSDDYNPNFATARSIDMVESQLRLEHVKYERGDGLLDSAGLPAALVAKLIGSRGGAPVYVPANGSAMFMTLLNTTPAAHPLQEQREMARNLLRQQAITKQAAAHTAGLRAHATISYQPGYGPPRK